MSTWIGFAQTSPKPALHLARIRNGRGRRTPSRRHVTHRRPRSCPAGILQDPPAPRRAPLPPPARRTAMTGPRRQRAPEQSATRAPAKWAPRPRGNSRTPGSDSGQRERSRFVLRRCAEPRLRAQDLFREAAAGSGLDRAASGAVPSSVCGRASGRVGEAKVAPPVSSANPVTACIGESRRTKGSIGTTSPKPKVDRDTREKYSASNASGYTSGSMPSEYERSLRHMRKID